MSYTILQTAFFLFRLVEAAVLAGSIGLERELRQKDAGLRTHILVGLGAALIMEVSKYGFADVVLKDIVILDPSRIAAQVVSGIGFLGAGLILVRRGSIQGLTTAAGVWVAAAIGLAAGAGLPLLAVGATAIGLGSDLTFRLLELRLRRSRKQNVTEVLVRCQDGRGVLASIASTLANEGWNIETVSLNRNDIPEGLVENRIVMRGGNPGTLVERLASIQGVESIDFLSDSH